MSWFSLNKISNDIIISNPTPIDGENTDIPENNMDESVNPQKVAPETESATREDLDELAQEEERKNQDVKTENSPIEYPDADIYAEEKVEEPKVETNPDSQEKPKPDSPDANDKPEIGAGDHNLQFKHGTLSRKKTIVNGDNVTVKEINIGDTDKQHWQKTITNADGSTKVQGLEWDDDKGALRLGSEINTADNNKKLRALTYDDDTEIVKLQITKNKKNISKEKMIGYDTSSEDVQISNTKVETNDDGTVTKQFRITSNTSDISPKVVYSKETADKSGNTKKREFYAGAQSEGAPDATTDYNEVLQNFLYICYISLLF